MIDKLIQNETFRRLTPPVAAVLLILAFVSLGMWQLDRAGEKRAVGELFESTAAHVPLDDVSGGVPYEPFLAGGRYLADRQVLIENMVMRGRLGYYVITPFEYAVSEPLLLINRGWIERRSADTELPAIDLQQAQNTVKGKVGRLPRVGIRTGEAFAASGAWPQTAVFPTAEDFAAVLDRDVLPFIMLLDPGEANGYLRDWRPREMGPMRHMGYAVQWFGLATTVLVILVWNLRRRRRRERS